MVRRRLRPSPCARLARRKGGLNMAISPTFQSTWLPRTSCMTLLRTNRRNRLCVPLRPAGSRATVLPKLSCSATSMAISWPYCRRRTTSACRTLGCSSAWTSTSQPSMKSKSCSKTACEVRPPVGECYGLDTVVDDSIEEQPEVYLEGGDHATLVHMSHAQFAALTATARHSCFSVHD